MNCMATTSREVTRREREHTALSTQIAQEGIVLLENKGVLPFENVKTVALYGSGARRTVRGGTGSGDVNVRSFVTVEQGLQNAGYTLLGTARLDAYDRSWDAAEKSYYANVQAVAAEKGPFVGLVSMMGNPLVPPQMPALQKDALEAADAAVYVLSRNSGEGADRKLSAGDYLLTEKEKADIQLLSQHYEKFVLLLNAGGVVELAPVQNLPGAIVLMSQGGNGCGDAIAAVLSGTVNPSGKLTATWAEKYEDYPFAMEFAPVSGEPFDSYYKEDLFVGYRYFDTFGVRPLYPFGYGLSYTHFSIFHEETTLDGNVVRVQIRVKNCGKRAGKEVVQLYVGRPEENRPTKELVAFGKTRLLMPGETETVCIEVSIERLATWQEERAGWVLVPGEYVLYLGNSVSDAKPVSMVAVLEETVVEQCRRLLRGEMVSELTAPDRESPLNIPRLTFTGNIHPQTHSYAFDTVPENTLSPEELAELCVGAARLDLSSITIVGNFSDGLPGAAGETTARFGRPITMVDGPAGIRVNPILHEKDGRYIKVPQEDPIFRHLITPDTPETDLTGTETKYQYCTALPIATMLAQTWDMKLLQLAGRVISEEMKLLGVDLWLAPALNIQRNPLCGRNFEYFSEDPLVSGLCAAAITRGVQSIPGKGAVIKHFAANNQETNRNFNNSHVSARTLRELYLKGFEICVKTVKPLGVMTSLNLINGVHAAADKELLTDILRHEWGFDGLVMTDWGTTGVPGSTKEQKYDCTWAVDCMKAGNDLIMPGSQRDVDYIRTALKNGTLDITLVRRWADNILKTAKKGMAD